jgi:hypothetical protein
MRPIGSLKIRRHVPKDKRNAGVISQPRVPHHEPLSPGLRKEDLPEAIGFVHHFKCDDEDYDEEDGDWA